MNIGLKCLIGVMLTLPVLGGIDPFYTKLLNTGKELYLQKKYSQAAESFRVAEFGLLSERETLKELYPFYALALDRSDRVEEAKKILQKMLAELDIEDFSAFAPPEPIDAEFRDLLARLNLIAAAPVVSQKKPKKKADRVEKEQPRDIRPQPPPPSVNASAADSMNQAFAEIRLLILNNDFKEAQKRLRELKSGNGQDPRSFLLQGMLQFQRGRDNAALEELEPLVKMGNVDRGLREEAEYYMVLAHYRQEHYGKALLLISSADPKNRERLSEVKEKIMSIREQAFVALGRDFSRRGFDDFRDHFAGDNELCHDFLRFLLQNYRYRTEDLLQTLELCLTHQDCYEKRFVLLAVSYLRSRNEMDGAIRFVRSTYFFKQKNANSIPVWMSLIDLYLEKKELETARDLVVELQSFSGGDEEVQKKFDKIKKEINVK